MHGDTYDTKFKASNPSRSRGDRYISKAKVESQSDEQKGEGGWDDEGCIDDGGRLKDLILVLHAAWSAKVLFM